MSTTAFDPIKYKQTTRQQWQTAAEAWNDYNGLLRWWLGPATELGGPGVLAKTLETAGFADVEVRARGAAANDVRGRMRQVRAALVRRAPPDVGGTRRGGARGCLARDRERAEAIRARRRVRRNLRAARGGGDQPALAKKGSFK
jgi:hypothetical protein